MIEIVDKGGKDAGKLSQGIACNTIRVIVKSSGCLVLDVHLVFGIQIGRCHNATHVLRNGHDNVRGMSEVVKGIVLVQLGDCKIVEM